MSISRIGPNQVQPTTITYSSQAVSNKVGGGGGRDPLPVVDKADVITLSIDRKQEVQTPVADNKTTDTADTADTMISKMKEKLDAIVMKYPPPYPTGHFSKLSKEIETIPRDVEIPELSVSSDDAEVGEMSLKSGHELKGVSVGITTQPKAFLSLLG